MALETTETSLENQLILELKGRLDALTTDNFQKLLLQKIESAQADIILDCQELEFVSSAGLRTLLSGQKAIQKRGYSIQLTHVGEVIMKVLEMTGFDKILKLSET